MVTGLGVVSSIGNSKAEVLRSLRESRSGIEFVPEMKELGYKLPVAGLVKGLKTDGIEDELLQTMSGPAKYAAVAALEALRDARLPVEALRTPRAGVVVGTGGAGANEASRAVALLRARKSPAPHPGATGVVRMVNSTAALTLGAWLGVKGRCYSVSSACCTGTDSIGHGFELIRHGLVDLCISGGAEESASTHAWGFFDALGDAASDLGPPEKVCRPYDRDRRGMVVSEGAGIVILEAVEHAERRGAPVYGEVLGYDSANDGHDMFQARGTGLKRCLEGALESAKAQGPLRIDYINPHGAGTKVGDPVEVRVIREVFGTPSPLVSSTKPLNGHSQGAAGAHEAIFTLLMLDHGFVVPTANLDHVAPECEGVRHVRSLVEIPLTTVMSFNAGLGGASACLIFRRL